MKRILVGHVGVALGEHDLEIASYYYGCDEDGPCFERTWLVARPFDGFFFVGTGGDLTYWNGPKDDEGRLKVMWQPVSEDEAMAWVTRFAPQARYWVAAVGPKLVSHATQASRSS
jgi:hypothetical protein